MQENGSANASLEAYLSSGKDPNHFLTRARTQALRTQQFGKKPEPVNKKNAANQAKSGKALDISTPTPVVEAISERPDEEEAEGEGEDVPLRRCSSDLGGNNDNNIRKWSKEIIGTGKELMQAVKKAPLVRHLISDGEQAASRNDKEEAANGREPCSWSLVLPEQDQKAKQQPPMPLAPGMVCDEEEDGEDEAPSDQTKTEVQKSDDMVTNVSKQTPSDADQNSGGAEAAEDVKPNKSERRISEMVRGITSTSQTQEMKDLINKKVSGKPSLLQKLARKSLALQRVGQDSAMIADPILAKFGNFRKKLGNSSTIMPTRSFSKSSSKSRNSSFYSRASGTQTRLYQASERWRRIVDATWFSMAACAIVMLHSIFLAIDTDFDLGTGVNSISFAVDGAFTAIYIAELTVRVLAYRQYYLMNSWNILDLMLVCLSVVDIIVVLASSSADPSLTVMASLRMIRLLRLVRLVRVFRFFKPLWLLVCGIAASMRTVFWAWLLINLLIYIFGLAFTRVYSPHTCAVDDEGHTPDPELYEYFGNVGRSMFSTFQCITMEDWIVLADVGARHEPWTRVLFMMILGTCTWGVMHVITAVFVESALEASHVRSTDLAKKAKEEYNETCRKLCEVFWKADADNDGSLTKPEFLKALAEPGVVEKLRDLGIDRSSAVTLFDILDLDGSGTLDSAEFVEGVLRSRGPAQNKDVIGMRCDVWRVQLSVQDELDRACTFIEAKLRTTMDRVKKLQKEAAPVLQCAAEQLARSERSEHQHLSSTLESIGANPALNTTDCSSAAEATRAKVKSPTTPGRMSWAEEKPRVFPGDLPSTTVVDFDKPAITRVVSRSSTSDPRRRPASDV